MTTPPDALPAASRSLGGRWLLIAGAVVISVLLASNGVTLWMLVAGDPDPVHADVTTSQDPHDAPDEPRPAEGTVVRLDPMTTTVGGTTVRHARLTMAVVLVEGVEPTAIDNRVPLLQDALLLELSAMSGEQLHRTEGARALRERMTDHARTIWDDDIVSRVVFTELVIP